MYAQILLFISILLVYIRWSIRKKYEYWSKKNVPFIKAKNPFFGNMTELLLKGVPLVKYHETVYNQLAPHRYGGYFHFYKPVFVVRDPELIKTILIKDFAHFANRGSDFVDEQEPLLQNIFNLGGEKWKNLRMKTSPAFSPGKIKTMFGLMKECSEQMVDAVDETLKIDGNIEVKELMSRFTTDVISSCIFGLRSNTLKNPDSVFRQMSKRIFENRITRLLNYMFPRLRHLHKFKIIDEKVNDFFVNLVKNTIKYRETNKVTRNDFLDLLIALRRDTGTPCFDDAKEFTDGTFAEKKFELTDDLLTAQCFLFFIAGYETSSETLTFALYELAKHQDIQVKLRREIDTILEGNDGELTYEAIQNLTYLDQVISETLRLYPIFPYLVRECTKNYALPETDVIIEEKTRVIISVLGLHHDPKYYSNPLEFNPDNFAPEIRSQRPQCTYLPFGEGPRGCIGMKFASTQVKLGLAMLIRYFNFELSPKMEFPLKFKKYIMFIIADGDVLLTFSRR